MYNNSIPSNSNNNFRTSSELYVRWMTSEITIHDFLPGGEYLVKLFHSHRYMELLYIRSGRGQMQVEGETAIDLMPGNIVFLNHSISHKLISDSNNPLQTILMSFSIEPFSSSERVAGEWVEDERRIIDAVLSSQVLCTMDVEGRCLQYIEQVEKCANSKRIGELIIIKNLMSCYLMSAFQCFTRFSSRNDFDSILQSVPILSASRITEYIQSHFTENITIASVAENLFYSPRQCQRIIRECLGISFSDFLADIRLSHAKKLLSTTDFSIEKIAELSGFKSGKSFSRLLREKEGITPYRYRKENKISLQED